MRGPHNIWRLVRTGATFERTGAMRKVLEMLDAPAGVRIAARILGWPFSWLGHRGDPDQPPILRAITALGPAYVKFGQLMSTRPDIVGVELANELQVLQDSLPAFDTDLAKAEFESQTGMTCDAVFSSFSEPVAAASIAQVHKGKLKGSQKEVAVKVLRPGIERAFRRDVDAFHLGAQFVELLSPASRRLRPRAVIEHFGSVVEQELDLRTEAAAAAEFKANAADDEGFEIPGVIWEYSGKRVLVLDWEAGTPLADLDALEKTGHDLKALGAHIVQMFLRHALRDGYFHADMHQGNLKLSPDGNLIALDFGIMGRIDTYTRRVYAEILMGFIRRDYRRVAEVHFEAGYVPADQDVDAFAQALRAVGEPIFGQDANQISMARLLSHLFEVTERFGMETRTELILLQRTMVVVEGVGRSLDPNLNIWSTAKPVVEKYIAENLGPKAMIADLTKAVQSLARFGPRLPQIIEGYLSPKPTPPAPKRKLWRDFGFVAVGILGASAIWALLHFA